MSDDADRNMELAKDRRCHRAEEQAVNTITSVQIVGGPHDGLVVEDWAVPQPWPTVLRIARHTSMIGKRGVVAASAAYRVDEHVRCGEGKYRYVGTKQMT